MGLGNCTICINEDFIYIFDERLSKHIWLCDNCMKRIKQPHQTLGKEDNNINNNVAELIRQIAVTYKWENDFPDMRNNFYKRRQKLCQTLKQILYVD